METRGFFQFISSIILYIFIVPIIYILLFVNEVVRFIVSIHLRIKYNGNVVLVSDGADGFWAFKHPARTRMGIIALMLDKSIPIETLQKNFNDSVFQLKSPNGKRIYSKLENILVLKCGYACWQKDERFDLNNHFRSFSTSKVYNKLEMQQEIAQMAQDMSEERPQWEFISVPRFVDSDDDSEKSVFIFRFQHAYMDGFSYITMMNHVTSGFTYYFHPLEFRIPFWKNFLFYTNAVIFGPYAAVLLLFNVFDNSWPQRESGMSNKTVLNYSWTKSMDLGVLKTLRKRLNHPTIPTILENAFVSAALEVLGRERVPKKVSNAEVVALLPYPNISPQNRLTVFIYKMNSLQPALERIKTSKTESWKGLTGPWIPLFSLIKRLMGRQSMPFQPFLMGRGSMPLLFSNVPVSKTKFSFMNTAEVVDVLAFTPQQTNTGITLCSRVYENSVKMTAVALSTWLTEKELEDIIERIPQLLDEWVDELGSEDEAV
ncbi:hypothetical protein Ocin01_18680 [Orchesella cincta]|uniref:O-acyltransferase WSD1-like N-terminal domain-containing protein n=1 Tax=Orchesella cincta TaxID=48709 RepID=A0A1D2M518_ORCCI|nr:hypothetical protein Ocin01_18680 [Orchesella cincta]